MSLFFFGGGDSDIHTHTHTRMHTHMRTPNSYKGRRGGAAPDAAKAHIRHTRCTDAKREGRWANRAYGPERLPFLRF